MASAGAAALPLALSAQQQALGGSKDHGLFPALPDETAAPVSLPDKTNFRYLKETYLNSASQHPKLLGSLAWQRRAGAFMSGQPGGAEPSQERICANFSKLIHADPGEVVLVPSTQAGESLVAAALGLPAPGAHVVTDVLHFEGSLQMYQEMRKRGLDVTFVKMSGDGRIRIEDLDQAIVPGKTRLVAISSTSFINGFQHDVQQVCERAHAKGALVYADMIQSAGNSPTDVKKWGVDAACCATYKWLMSPGTAFLYVNAGALAKLQAPLYHWTQFAPFLPVTHMYPFDAPAGVILDHYHRKPGAAGLFSTGYEPNIEALAGLEYSLPYILDLGVDRIQAHARPLAQALQTELRRRGYRVLTPPDCTAPIVTIAMDRPETLAPVFRKAKIELTIRWNTIRVAFSVFNDQDDVHRLLAAMPRTA